MIDLRSDTVTQPTPEMREAMARAEVGDDVYGEDPTVNRLEAIAADVVGKQAAVFVPSGTMANLAALLVHCTRGSRALVGAQSHSFRLEAGGASALGGVMLFPVPNTGEGGLELAPLREELEAPPNLHVAEIRAVALENTHNLCGGAAVPLSHAAEVAELARRRKVALHLDGARIFNAALALETSARRLADPFDTVSFCFSKGLACPVGSVLCGSREVIAGARRVRKLLGGGMRQAGVIAAAGIVALATMVARLAEDHANARRLAAGLARLPGIALRMPPHPTNMVYFELEAGAAAADRLAADLKQRGVLLGRRGSASFRAVTHYGIGAAEVDRACAAIAQVSAQLRPQ